MPDDDQPEQRRPGRPRYPEVEAAIIRATQRALANDGYARMSVDSIAAAAKVTKPTIYRRWPTKADLATAAIAALQTSNPLESSGDLHSDLLAHLRHFREGLARPQGMAMIGTLLTEEAHTPELMKLFRERIVATRRSWVRAVLEDARARGAVRADLDAEATATMMLGAYYAVYLQYGAFPAEWDERILATIWPAIISGETA